jgi:hypothetical protein
MVCKPKKHGGLGVLNLELQNKALLIKQLHKFFTKENMPWVHLIWSLYGEGVPHAQLKRGSFWWRDIFGFVDDYRAITQCSIGDGKTVLFWKDFWLNGELLCEKFPRLFSFALDEDISVNKMHSSEDRFSHFVLPLSIEAFQEFEMVNQCLLDNPIETDAQDKRIFPWNTPKCTPAKFYNFLFAQLQVDLASLILGNLGCFQS